MATSRLDENAILVPVSGTRPTGQSGLLRFNSNSSEFEVHDGSNWQDLITSDDVGNLSVAFASNAGTVDGLNGSQFVRSDTGNNFVDFNNKEQADYDVDGRLYWDASAGLYIKSSNVDASGPRLIWSGANVNAGGGINISYGGEDEPTISHSDTSTQGSVNNGGGTVVQDIFVDGYGHITNINSNNLDSRYYRQGSNPQFGSRIGFNNDSNVILHDDSNSASGVGFSGKDAIYFRGDNSISNLAVIAGHFRSTGNSDIGGDLSVGSIDLRGGKIWLSGLQNNTGDYLDYETQEGIRYYENGDNQWKLSGGRGDSFINNSRLAIGKRSANAQLDVDGDILGNNLFAQGQQWRELTGSRSIGVTYTNTTGRPIMVSVVMKGDGGIITNFRVDGEDILLHKQNGVNSVFRGGFQVVVPAGSSYRAFYSGGSQGSVELARWSELR